MTKPLTLLILEDQAEILESIKLLLSELPFKVVSASDGIEALQYLKDNQDVSLILSDINTPRMNGLEFLSVLKKDPILCRIPVILQSAATDEEVQEGLSKGADLWLPKPYTGAELYAAIIKVLANQLQEQ